MPPLRRFHLLSLPRTALLTCITLIAAQASAQEGLPELYSPIKTRTTNPNALLVADTTHTEVPELFVSDVVGTIRMYEAISGKEMASRSFGADNALTPPQVGDFFGRNRLDIVMGTKNGELLILDGGTLETLFLQKVGTSFSIAPTIQTVKSLDGVERDRIILVDSAGGTVRGFEMGPKRELGKVFEAATGTRIESPPTLGHTRSSTATDLVACANDGFVYLIDADTGRFERFLINQERQMPFSPLVADVNGNSIDDIVLVTNSGDVECWEYDASRNPATRKSWSYSTTGTPTGPPMMVRKGSDVTSTRIVQLTNSKLTVLEATSGARLAEDDRILSGPKTEAALIPRTGKYPELALGFKSTVQVTANFGDWVDSGNTTVLKLLESTMNYEPTKTLVVATGEEREGAAIFGISSEGYLSGYRTPYAIARSDWPTKTPWMTRGGTPLHNAILDRGYATNESKRRDRFMTALKQWEAELETARKEGNWAAAFDLVGRLVDADPYNESYRSLRTEITVRKNLATIALGVIGGILIVGFASLKIGQVVSIRRLRMRAESAVVRGELDEARRFYQKLSQRQPKNPKVSLALARVCISQRDYSSETLPFYEAAYKVSPKDVDLINSYARALLLEPKSTAAAAEVYEKALPSFPEPELLEYGLGRCDMAAGRWEDAGKRLRSALRGGLATDGVYAALCEVYLKTKNFSAKSLPVFEQQFPVRQEDREFLEAYLSCCIDAKKTDPKVESLCQAVLEYSPQHIPAYLHLALVLLQKNQVGAAVEEIRSVLKIDPNHAQALSLLAHCFMMQSRRDDEAIQAYRGALAANPGDREMLLMLATILFERSQFDPESFRIYEAAYQENPADPNVLKALAQAAQLRNDDELTIRSIEALGHLGLMNQKLTAQLATSYLRRGVTEPKAEKVLREALRSEPNNVEYVGALAKVLVAQDRTDTDCIAVYENHIATYKDDIPVGRQLARTYIKCERYENALALAQRLLKVAPEDEELQRLRALASLYDNKIDEAVSEYQRLLERNPNDKEALVNLALAYGQKMRTDADARALYDRALVSQPNNDLLHLAMARVHAANGDASNAVEACKKALAARPHNEQNVIGYIIALLNTKPDLLRLRWFLVEIMVLHGRLRESMEQLEFINSSHPGQQNNLLKALETILGKDPGNVVALTMRGKLLLATGALPEAIKHLEKANQLRPSEVEIVDRLAAAYTQLIEKKEEPEVRFKLGKLHFSMQDFDKAIGCFQKTAQDYRWEAESTKMLAKCFTGKGMLDLALQEYKKLVVDAETKELLYDLAQRYEAKKDLVGAKTVYRQLFAADINFKDVKTRFEMLSGSTSDPMAFEKTSIVQQMSEEAARRYELLDELGRGAMGIVYRAQDKELEEVVALKILPDNMSNNPEAVRRFKIEARNARKLSHPNIVRIHDIGEEMGRKYISMEYVDGTDLKKKIKTSPEMKMPLPDVIRHAMQIADALGYAHRLGIVHRDIKPANIMLTSGEEVKVTDFGIAKMMDGAGEGTMVGAVIGTPLYMSPEQVQGIPVDNRADLYSYGIMLYEMLNGRPPYTEGDLAYQHIHKDPSQIPGVPQQLWGIVAKCLAKRKEDRWPNAEAIYDALRDFKKQAGMG